MDEYTLADRAARFLRPYVWASCALAVPIFLVSYVYSLRLIFDALGPGLFVIVCIAHSIIWLGASMLHDWQEEESMPLRRALRKRPADQ